MFNTTFSILAMCRADKADKADNLDTNPGKSMAVRMLDCYTILRVKYHLDLHVGWYRLTGNT